MNEQEPWRDRRPRPSGLVLRWLKFNLVGGIGIGVQLAALAILRSLLHLDYLVATALAVETAVLHNFVWHERFTWADRPAPQTRLSRLAKFHLADYVRLQPGMAEFSGAFCTLATRDWELYAKPAPVRSASSAASG